MGILNESIDIYLYVCLASFKMSEIEDSEGIFLFFNNKGNNSCY